MEKQDNGKFEKYSILTLLLLFSFGIIEFFAGENIIHIHAIQYFNDYAIEDVDFMHELMENTADYGRSYRVESLPCFSFNYGIFSNIIGLYIMYLYYLKQKKMYLYVSILCGLGGAILCGSRSVLTSMVLSYYFMLLLTFWRKYKILYTFAALLIVLFIAMFFNFKFINQFLDIFLSGGENAGGSSTDLRINQLQTSLVFFTNHPIFGNGTNYLSKITSYSSLKASMYGSESLIFSVLIDEGLLGIFYTGAFLISLMQKFYQNMRNSAVGILGLSITIAFLVFSLLTGIQGAWLVFMPFTGYVLSIIKKSEINKRKQNYGCINRIN